MSETGSNYHTAFGEPVRNPDGRVLTVEGETLKLVEYDPEHPTYQAEHTMNLQELLESPEASAQQVAGAIGVHIDQVRREKLSPESLLKDDETTRLPDYLPPAKEDLDLAT